jgi:hypothetical protein
MAGIIPTQERSVDPFASYNSNVINRLTNMITRGDRGIVTVYDLQVTIDSTSPNTTVVISSGYCFKDDVMIEVQSESTMQILGTGADTNYAHSFNPASASDGYYYIVLYYNYQKSRPVPQAILYAVESTNTSAIYPNNTGDYVLLKVVNVSGGVISSVLDYDPGTIANVREYLPTMVGAVGTTPTFDALLHMGRIIYDIDQDIIRTGGAAAWQTVGTGSTNKYTYSITAPGGWSLVSGVYRNDESIAVLGLPNRYASITCKDNSTQHLIAPYAVALTSITNCRIQMPVNTVSVDVTIIG